MMKKVAIVIAAFAAFNGVGVAIAAVAHNWLACFGWFSAAWGWSAAAVWFGRWADNARALAKNSKPKGDCELTGNS